jgi:hypothetical protein
MGGFRDFDISKGEHSADWQTSLWAKYQVEIASVDLMIYPMSEAKMPVTTDRRPIGMCPLGVFRYLNGAYLMQGMRTVK